ncbi:hypothetical protein ID866_8325 [Astraeus odoratus]|nr:hypothetical protein ID866_8325 [Astraeus odoratus]
MKQRSGLRSYSGYKKIIDTCRQAHVDKLEWVWVDTCCINKESSSELSEAINSMYQWYANSRLCYAYIHDIDDFTLPTDKDERRFEAFNGWPKWFSRGWTLQELVAPKKILFFNRKWEFIGDKQSLASAIGGITRIPYPILVYGLSSNRPCVAGIMSWSADRRTTREEDRAYSLLGLFGVHMPMLYGEGKNAFKRLQLEIIRTSNDQSIFAWDPRGHLRRTGSVLADDPSLFRDCSKITKLETDEFIKYCEGEPHAAERIGTFPVTNRGIQIWMPLQRYRGSRSVFKAKLACLGEFGIPVTIDVAYWRSNYYRYSNASHMDVGSSHTELRCVYLTYQDDAYYPDFTFKLDDRVLAFCGFTRYGTHPRDHGYDPLILSSTNPLSVITYANGNTGIRFALGLGYCFGQEWAHVNVLCSGLGSPDETPRIALANDPRNIYDKMWNAAPDHARRWAEENQQTPGGVNAKHAHIQASTSTVRLIYAKRTSQHEGIIMLDVAQCIGCCLGLLKWMQLRGVCVLIIAQFILRNVHLTIALYP